VLIELADSPIEILALGCGEREGLLLQLGSDAVPELFHQLEPFRGRQLEEFFAKVGRHWDQSLPPTRFRGKRSG
jgi:hypothetical protein